ncbi:translation elongation factor 4 [Candidatus Zixiibacteriota bacterium]
MNQTHIRNFCIVAHIDHGKSTLADRLLEETGTLERLGMVDQVLDDMDLERERGITIKMHPVRMHHTATDGTEFILNLIDTPGHVDFTYEVSRSLAACEGAVLVVDASQGIEAQTLSNLYLALEHDLEIIPVINKIDLASARTDMVTEELVELLGVDPDEIIAVSAKEGTNVPAVLEAIVDRVPPPSGDPDAPARALIFDSIFDTYRGAIPYLRVVDGEFRRGQQIHLLGSGKKAEIDEVGVLRLGKEKIDVLRTGEVGYLIASIKTIQDARVGDTIADADHPGTKPLPGYQKVKSMVFSGIYPMDSEDHQNLHDALERLKLNDAALTYEAESSAALGFGFRCGFLGLLHMEIVQERLSREHGLAILATIPSVEFRVHTTDGDILMVDNPAHLPPPQEINYIEEPYVKALIATPQTYIGNLMSLCQDRRGDYKSMEYMGGDRVLISFDLPLAEIVFDFYDRMKSVSRGYASLDYEFDDWRRNTVQKLDIMLNGEPVDTLSMIVHADKAYEWGRKLTQRLKKLIPRQQFSVAVQAAVGNKIIARETVSAFRKHVTAKCYGGDITRKRKLLEKQKEGKKRMKMVGSVEIPQEAFLAFLSMNEED